MERGRSTRSFVVLVTRCMYYGRPSGQTLNLCVKEHRKAVTSGDTGSYVCNNRVHYAQQPSTIIMHTPGGMAYIHEQPQPVNTERGLLPQVYDTSLDPNQLELPDLPPPYLPVLPCIPCNLYSSFSIVGYPVLFIAHFRYCMCG